MSTSWPVKSDNSSSANRLKAAVPAAVAAVAELGCVHERFETNWRCYRETSQSYCKVQRKIITQKNQL
jgi:hypothetical protein